MFGKKYEIFSTWFLEYAWGTVFTLLNEPVLPDNMAQNKRTGHFLLVKTDD